jgi:hypothetical protein
VSFEGEIHELPALPAEVSYLLPSSSKKPSLGLKCIAGPQEYVSQVEVASFLSLASTFGFKAVGIAMHKLKSSVLLQRINTSMILSLGGKY